MLLQRINSTKASAALIVLAFVFFLASGATGGNRAEAQEETTTSSGGQAVSGAPKPNAEAWALVDADSGLYLAGNNPDERLPMASTANILTALVVLEEGADPEEEVTVSRQAESYTGSTYSNVGLVAGDRLTVRDLLTAALVASGTDAVYALAEHLGVDGSVDNFVEKMNAKASSMGLEDTHFSDPAGLDASGNYSSARDLAAVARAALKYPLFAEIVRTRDATIGTQNRQIEIHNTNQLLSTYPKATGVKTGSLPEVGANLVASATGGNGSYVAIVLGDKDSEGRFRDAQAILEYGFAHYEHRTFVSRGEEYGEVTPPYRWGDSVGLVATQDIAGPAENGSEPERRVRMKELPPRAEASQELGEVEVLIGGQSVGRSPLVIREGYEEASPWDKARYAVEWLARRAWASFSG